MVTKSNMTRPLIDVTTLGDGDSKYATPNSVINSDDKDVREFDDAITTRDYIYDGILSALSSRFPIEDDEHRLELINPRYEGNRDYSLTQQKKALLSRRNLTTPLVGTWRLTHTPTGKVLDEREDVVMRVPYYTDRGTFIRNGSGFSVANQSRLLPGVYARRRRTGEIESQFNVLPGTGRGFRIGLEPKTGVFKVNVGGSNIPAYPFMRAMGITDQQLIKAWGPELVAINAGQNATNAIDKLYKKFAGFKAETGLDENQKAQFIAQSLPGYKLNSRVNARTLGLQNADGVTPDVLLRATGKMLNISNGEESPDDRDAPGFSEIYGVEDLLAERVTKDAGRVMRDAMFKIRRTKDLTPIRRGMADAYVDDLINGSGLASPLEGTNPLHHLEQMHRITKMGVGGIGSYDAITDEAHDVNPGQLGLIDPIAGPESAGIGVDVRTAWRTFKGKDRKLYGEFINHRTGKTELVQADDTAGSVVAFPGQDMKSDSVYAIARGRVAKVPTTEVDYVVPTLAHMLSANTNSNPMPTGVQAGRQFYGSKFWTQYMPQVKGEAPLVDSLMPDGTTTFTKHYGKRMGTITSKVGGRVARVTDTGIVIVDSEGKRHNHELVQNLPFNSLTGLSYFPSVKTGDIVEPDTIIAHSNFTDSEGNLALGQNLKTAVIPYKGKTFEDANVISASAAKKLSTSRLYGYDQDNGVKAGAEINLNRYMSAFPQKFSKEQYDKIDDNGVAKVGTVLEKGDPIILAVGPKMLTAADAQLGKLHKALRSSFTDKATVWEHDHPGTVVDVAAGSRGARVNIAAEVPAKIGDKLCYDSATEILTSTGWKFFSELQQYDNVAAMNPVNHEFEYIQPVAIHKYKHNGVMYHANNSNIDLCTTTNHKMYVRDKGSDKYELLEATEVYGNNKVHKRDAVWRSRMHATDIAELNAPDISASVYKYLTALGTDIRNNTYVKIPEWVAALPTNFILVLFNAALYGAGLFSKLHAYLGNIKLNLGYSVSITTQYKHIADSLQQLCLHLGYIADIEYRDTKYTIAIRKSSRYNNIDISAGIVEQHDESWVEYNGTVYCCELPKWHVLYVRRNGKALWCGNSTRFGLKGVIGEIVDDDKMPRDAVTNEPYDILLNPMGVLSRVAPNQIVEMSLGKLAKHTGERVLLPQIPPQEGWDAWADAKLQTAGVIPEADIYDPTTGKTIKGIGDGYTYVSAFHHIASEKLSTRGAGGRFTADEQPASGGATGSKRFSGLDVTAALSHGATGLIRDMMAIKGTKNEDFWKALKTGRPLPEPEVPFVYNKFLNTLRAAGVNVVDKGDTVAIMPMSDIDIDTMSAGAVRNSNLVDYNLKPIPGGLFDEGTTGGPSGNKWTHIDLPEPLPNPVMFDPIRRVLGLKVKELEDIVAGRNEIAGGYGGNALKSALSSIDIDTEIEKHKDIVQSSRGTKRDNSVKTLGYLLSAKEQGLKPKDWLITKIPVIPPVFRPISRIGDVALVADINELYRDVIESANTFNRLKPDLPDTALTEERDTLYKAVTAAVGLGESITPEGRARNLKGAMRQIIGTQPKRGLYQQRVISKAVSGVGRAVATPDPNMDMDHVGIPEDSAWELYKDFVMRRLVHKGYPVSDATRLIDNKSPVAKTLLIEEMSKRPVVVDRAPTWHKFNLMAFYPVISDGDTLRASPLIVKGFNLDFDGDQVNFHVPISDRAVKDTVEKMLPSKNLISLTDLSSVRYAPSMEMTYGLYKLTLPPAKGKHAITFNTKAEAIKAYRDGKIDVNTPIRVMEL